MCGQRPGQGTVFKGWRRCLLSCQPGQVHGAWAAGTGRGQATSLTKQGQGSPSRRGCSRAAGLPHPKVAHREGHIPVSVMLGMWLPRQRVGEEEEEGLPGVGGWGRGPEPERPCRPWGETEEGQS